MGPAGRGGDGDVAAEADDIVETQLFGKHPVEFLVAEVAPATMHTLVSAGSSSADHQHTVLIEACVPFLSVRLSTVSHPMWVARPWSVTSDDDGRFACRPRSSQSKAATMEVRPPMT